MLTRTCLCKGRLFSTVVGQPRDGVPWVVFLQSKYLVCLSSQAGRWKCDPLTATLASEAGSIDFTAVFFLHQHPRPQIPSLQRERLCCLDVSVQQGLCSVASKRRSSCNPRGVAFVQTTTMTKHRPALCLHGQCNTATESTGFMSK